jgi:hypothetical protein
VKVLGALAEGMVDALARASDVSVERHRDLEPEKSHAVSFPATRV